MVEKPKDEKNVECALCAPFEQTGTWRCADCGAMNINKWKECWKCKAPRLAESGSGSEKPAEKVL
jgi:hypothetical protein